METPNEYIQSEGLVAILDALGAASYSDAEVTEFLKARSSVLELFDAKSEESKVIAKDSLSTFTFNDTVIVVCSLGHPPSLKEVKSFFVLLRKLVIDSLSNGILFRGSLAIGTFYKDDATNTIMGQAITDAAAWYDKAEWFGIHATPRATLMIDAMIQDVSEDLGHIAPSYDVPFKNGKALNVKTVNWPRGFYVKNVTPCKRGEDKRAKLLQLLGSFSIPSGVEDKYFNSLRFFDEVSQFEMPKN